MKAKIQKVILWILLKLNHLKRIIEQRKMWRITEDIINLPSRDRKQAIAKMRFRFRKNKKRGPFIYAWCDEIEVLGNILDQQREETGQQTKLNYRDMRKDYIMAKKFDSTI